MSYDPLEPFVRDKIRRLVRDHSDDPAEEFFPDETYDKVILEHAPSWKRACAEMALSVAGAIEEDPTAMGSDGDSMSWTQRTKSLYALHTRMIAEADADDAAVAISPSAPAFALIPPPVDWR